MELELSEILGFAVQFAIFVLIWELTPARTWFYKLKMGYEAAMILFPTSKPGQFVKRHARVFHLIEDFALFLLLFKWKDGVIFETISAHVVRFWERHSSIGNAFDWIWTNIVYLSPFGREIANYPDFRTPLIVCSIVTALWAVIFMWAFFFSDDKCVPMGILMCLFSIGSWYLGFWSCYLLQKVYAFSHIFGIVLTVLVALVINFVVTCSVAFIYDEFS